MSYIVKYPIKFIIKQRVSDTDGGRAKVHIIRNVWLRVLKFNNYWSIFILFNN